MNFIKISNLLFFLFLNVLFFKSVFVRNFQQINKILSSCRTLKCLQLLYLIAILFLPVVTYNGFSNLVFEISFRLRNRPQDRFPSNSQAARDNTSTQSFRSFPEMRFHVNETRTVYFMFLFLYSVCLWKRTWLFLLFVMWERARPLNIELGSPLLRRNYRQSFMC